MYCNINMKYDALLSIAKENALNKPAKVACYPTKFKPLRKETKQSRELTENIKKFFAKKEVEERKKAEEEKRKKEVIGPNQCVDDDYGYTSQEASALYETLMNKYNSMPSESRQTKGRVWQALKQQESEKSLVHKGKRKRTELVSNERNRESDRKTKDVEEEKEKEEKPQVKKIRQGPPPMDYQSLLRLAHQNQHESVKMKPKEKQVDKPERLMTKKQMDEYAKGKEWRAKNEQGGRTGVTNTPKTGSEKSLPTIPQKSGEEPIEKAAFMHKSVDKSNDVHKSAEKSKFISKSSDGFNDSSKYVDKNSINKSGESRSIVNRPTARSSTSNQSAEKSSLNRPVEKTNESSKRAASKVSEKDAIAYERKKLEEEKRQLEKMRCSIEEEKRKLHVSKSKKVEESQSNSQKSVEKKSKDPVKSSISKEPARPSASFPKDSDKPSLSNPMPTKTVAPNGMKSRPAKLRHNKRRFIDSDDEEYDPEMADFIVDDPEEKVEEDKIRKHISAIFRYDRSKYVEDDDDDIVESNFAEQMKEERQSAKIGLMEDLIDMRKEALEKKKKAHMKKRKL